MRLLSAFLTFVYRSKPRLPLEFLAVLVLFLLIVVQHLNTAPIWDSASFLQCIDHAVSVPFSLPNFRCSSHPSFLYFLLLGLTQYLDPGNASLVYVANALLAIAAAIAFRKLLLLLFRNHLTETDRALLSGLLLFGPVFLAHLLYVNLDFGLTCFVVLFLAFLLHGRTGWAAAAATAMIFSKEPGMAVYASSALLYGILFLLPKARKRGWRCTGLDATFLLIPGVLIILYFFALNLHKSEPFWGARGGEPLVMLLFSFPTEDKSLQSFLVDLFVLNFQWLLTLTIAIAAARFTFFTLPLRNGKGGKKDSKIQEGMLTPARGVFLVFLSLSVVYVVTRVRPYNNARYVLVFLPFLLLLFSWALATLIHKKVIRTVVLCLFLLVTILSDFRTVDPLSMSFFSTFPFGTHRILLTNAYIPSGTRGRDELVYNLEYLHFQTLYGLITQERTFTPNTILLMGRNGNFFFPPPLDPTTLQPSARVRNTFSPRVFTTPEYMIPKDIFSNSNPPVMYYISFPNLENDENLSFLRSHYQLISEKTYNDDGYQMMLSVFGQSPSARTGVQPAFLP